MRRPIASSIRAARGGARGVPFAAGAVAALAAGALVLAAAGSLGGDDEAGGGDGGASPPGAISLATLPVDSPAGVALGGGSAWVTSYERNTVTRLDAASGRADEPVEVGTQPAAVALAGGSLFVAQTGASRISRLDLGRGEIAGQPIEPAGGDGDSLEVGEGAVWATVDYESRLLRIDPESGMVTRQGRIPDGIAGDMAVGEGAVWAVGARAATVVEIDPETLRVVGRAVTVGSEPEDEEFGGQVAAGEGAIWATSPEDDTVVRIDPRSHEVVARVDIRNGLSSGDLATGLGGVWVADDNGELVRIDPATNRADPISISPGTVGTNEIEIGEGAIWITGDFERDAVVRIVP